MISVSDPVNHPYSYKLSLLRGNFWIGLHRILLTFETIKMLVINYLQTNSVSNKNELFSQIPISHLSHCWRTGKRGVLQSMGLQRVGHNLATEQQQHKYILAVLLWRLGCMDLFKLVHSMYIYIYTHTDIHTYIHECIHIYIHVHTYVCVCVSMYTHPGVEFLGLFLVFWEISILFFTVATLVYIPTNSVQVFPFLYILTNIYLCSFWW